VEPIPEAAAPFVSGVVAVVPLVAVALAWWRSRSPRLLLAALAFATFCATGLGIAALALAGRGSEGTTEWIEFGSDVVTITLFALSFLWPRAEPDA
jgi:hypothetical protein